MSNQRKYRRSCNRSNALNSNQVQLVIGILLDLEENGCICDPCITKEGSGFHVHHKDFCPFIQNVPDGDRTL